MGATYPNHYQMKKNRLTKLSQSKYKCEMCNKKATQVHHIDKTKNNHSIDNLMAVCQKCHTKLHENYKNLKQGRKGLNKKHPKYTMKEIASKADVPSYIVPRYFNNKTIFNDGDRKRLKQFLKSVKQT